MSFTVQTSDGVEVEIHMSSRGCPPHFKGMATTIGSNWTIIDGKWYGVSNLERSLHRLRDYIKTVSHAEFIAAVLKDNEPWSDEIVEWKPDPTLRDRWREAMKKVSEGK